MTVGVLLPGCGGEVEAKLEDYLEELEFDAPLDPVKEVQLGEHHPQGFYRISVAASNQDALRREIEPVWVEVKFKLFVVIAPESEKMVRAAVDRYRGRIDDVVVSNTRRLSLEELDDIRLATLKSRLIDALRPLLGEDRIRQLIFDDFHWDVI
ncbi:MAG: hypothetical protein MI725_15335 [Pirellulales bacterium]|nr:hypothetical protein [Pirellulales bacterium]